MVKIQQHYIDEAIRIRNSYIENIKLIQEKEDIIEHHKNELQNIISNVSEYVNDIKKENAINETNIQQKLNDILSEIEEKMNIIKIELKPFVKKTEELQKDSKILYNMIKEQYPLLTDAEIQQQIFKHIPQ